MALLFAIVAPFRKSTNLFDSIKSLRFVARIYGLLSFSINCTTNGEIKNCELRVFDILYAMMHIVMCLASSLLTFVYFNGPQDIWGMILLSGMEFLLISAVLLGSVSIVLDMLNRNRIIEMLQKIQQFDKQVNLTSSVLAFNQYNKFS